MTLFHRHHPNPVVAPGGYLMACPCGKSTTTPVPGFRVTEEVFNALRSEFRKVSR